MKIKELREAIKKAGGRLDLANGVSVFYDGGDVDVKANNDLIGWISSSKDEDKDVESELSLASEIIKHIGAFGAFAQYVGVPVEGVEPITITKEIVVPDVKVSADLSRVQSDYQRSENERGAEKRAYQWVVSELADKLRN